MAFEKSYEIIISDATAKKTGEEWALQAPEYNPQFVEDMKTQIPVGERRWDPGRQAWVVTEKWLPVAEGILVRYWPTERQGGPYTVTFYE